MNQASKKNITRALEADAKGISKFEIFLTEKNYPRHAEITKELRTIQALRSGSSAHKKSSKYIDNVKKITGQVDVQLMRLSLIIVNKMIAELSSLEAFFIQNNQDESSP